MDGRWRRWSIVVAALLIAGCAGVPTVGQRQRSDQSWVFAQTLMGSSGPLLVEILGTPYDVPQAALVERVLSEMTRAIAWSSTARFTTDPAVAGSQSMRVVWAFNGGPGGRTQCRGDGGGGKPQANGAVRINAVFCDDAFVIADITGRLGETGGIEDPAFAALIRQVTVEMFRPDPEDERDRVIAATGR